MRGLDGTAQITPVVAKRLKAAGIEFVCGYIVPESMAWKRLTRATVHALSDEDIFILSVFESTETRALSGAIGGMQDGKTALNEAKIINQPTDSTIYFAVDYDAGPKGFPAIGLYFKAAQEAIKPYEIGCYGSYAACEYLHSIGIEYLWQTYAWSRGKKSAYANVYQYKNGVDVCDISCDLDESYGDEGFWNLKGASMTDWDKKAVEFVTYFQKQTGISADGKAGADTLAKFDGIMKQIHDLTVTNSNLVNRINKALKELEA